MVDTNVFLQEMQRRRTFAIISHPDAGKTTVTEKLLLHGNAIQTAGTVKARKATRHATSDWMALEQARGISVTTSVMQFQFDGRVVNLLDTPGHEDFSEDTYRTLTAVDAALMVIDGVKGVEERTLKLLAVCRLRATPVWTFINKLDREIKDPIELLDELESKLNIQCTPVAWPVGMGKQFRGIYHIIQDCLYLTGNKPIKGLHSDTAKQCLGEQWELLASEVELVQGASYAFNHEACIAGQQTPVYFGTALGTVGTLELLQDFVQQAPPPQKRAATTRDVLPDEPRFSGFVFKIQANMNPKHHDRIAFMRVCSGCYTPGMRLRQTRSGMTTRVTGVVNFMAGERKQVDYAYPGDIVGLYNRGGIQIGDTYTEGEVLKFQGIPCFAPELFKTIRLRNPVKSKQFNKGVQQLAEEGAIQFFQMLESNDIVLGAIGVLQFEVVAFRLQAEYGVDCDYLSTAVQTARWVSGEAGRLDEFQRRLGRHCALDGAGQLTYLASNRINLQVVEEEWEDLEFRAVREA